MLVNSFDTKFGKTAEKYENFDNLFVNLLKKKKLNELLNHLKEMQF